jgi:hypothetical protein
VASPKKKIWVTLLWADRAAVDTDFAAGYSALLVKWASDFYQRFDFELDVAPRPGAKKEDAYAFTLAERDGVTIDELTAHEYAAIYARLAGPLSKESQQVTEESAALFAKLSHDQREVDRALQQFGTLPLPQWPAQAAKLASAFGELTVHAVEKDVKDKRHRELSGELDAVNQLYAYERRGGDFDVPVRLAVGDKMNTSSNADIVNQDRLKVVLCPFKLSPALAKQGATQAGPQPFGVTTNATYGGVATADAKRLYGRELIMINILRQEQITLAHEMVHAAGRRHQPDFKQIRSLGKMWNEVKAGLAGGKIILPTLFERVDGGLYDGPDDDIINYKSKGKAADKVQLYDKALMESAFFVEKP